MIHLSILLVDWEKLYCLALLTFVLVQFRLTFVYVAYKTFWDIMHEILEHIVNYKLLSFLLSSIYFGSSLSPLSCSFHRLRTVVPVLHCELMNSLTSLTTHQATAALSGYVSLKISSLPTYTASRLPAWQESAILYPPPQWKRCIINKQKDFRLYRQIDSFFLLELVVELMITYNLG